MMIEQWPLWFIFFNGVVLGATAVFIVVSFSYEKLYRKTHLKAVMNGCMQAALEEHKRNPYYLEIPFNYEMFPKAHFDYIRDRLCEIYSDPDMQHRIQNTVKFKLYLFDGHWRDKEKSK